MAAALNRCFSFVEVEPIPERMDSMELLNSITRAHFIGCGGAGMAPMVKIFHDEGISLSGSDEVESENFRKLEKLGVAVRVGHDSESLRGISGEVLVVHSSAVGAENRELAFASSAGWPILRRGEALAVYAGTRRRVMAVSGSHGKTTVTAMIAHILLSAGLDAGYLVGGKVNGWEWSGASGDGDLFVCEVDESDGTHALTRADVGLVTNIDDDHAWSVGGRDRLLSNFADFGAGCETLIYPRGAVADSLYSDHPNGIPLDLDSLAPLGPSEWGDYQRLNASLAVRAASEVGAPSDELTRSIETFPGVARRMTIHHQSEDIVLVEDYAHHPAEVRAVIRALRRRFSKHRLTVVFQPHRRARLARYFDDFIRELRLADRVVVAPVFAAWVEGTGPDAEDLASALGDSAVYYGGSWASVAERLMGSLRGAEVLAVLGAGDVEGLLPECLKRLKSP